MDFKDNFSEDEWFQITTAPSMVGSAVATAGRSGAIGTVKEMIASGKSLAAGAQNYPNNTLIQSIMPNPDMDRAEAKEYMTKSREKAMTVFKESGIQNEEQLADYALENLKTALTLLDGVASAADIADYKDWVRNSGQAVAEAAKEGGFLGFGGEQVSDAEKAILSRLDHILA